MKGADPREEIEAMRKGFQVVRVIKLAVPGLDAERHLVIVAPRA
jgi:16S rRNA (guanine527-N7)-methyltransferase